MAVRGIRGATTVAADSPDLILDATTELLETMVGANGVGVDDIASVIFTVTSDLKSEFPAVAARRLGWTPTPLLCMAEIPVPDSLPRCIRVLMHVNSNHAPSAITRPLEDDLRRSRTI
jgi:chorismate mutase